MATPYAVVLADKLEVVAVIVPMVRMYFFLGHIPTFFSVNLFPGGCVYHRRDAPVEPAHKRLIPVELSAFHNVLDRE